MALACRSLGLVLCSLALRGFSVMGDEAASVPSSSSSASSPANVPSNETTAPSPTSNGTMDDVPSDVLRAVDGVREGGKNAAKLAAKTTAKTYSYSQAEAVELAYLVTATYCRNLAGWGCGLACSSGDVADFVDYEDNSTGVRALVGRRNDDSCFLAFRGTQNVAGVQADLLSVVLTPKTGCWYGGRPCMVSGSFQAQYDAASPYLKDALSNLSCADKEIDIVGHSLGGAMATLAGWDLAVSGYNLRRVYTFGAPRQGNSDFAEAVRQVVTIMRVTRADDPVVLVPWLKDGYVHTGIEVYFSGAVSDGFRLCYGEDDACSVSNSGNFALNLLSCAFQSSRGLCGHFKYMNNAKTGLMMDQSCTAERRLDTTDQDIFYP